MNYLFIVYLSGVIINVIVLFFALYLQGRDLKILNIELNILSDNMDILSIFIFLILSYVIWFSLLGSIIFIFFIDTIRWALSVPIKLGEKHKNKKNE